MKSTLLCLFLIGCDDPNRNIVGPDGDAGVAVDCFVGGANACLEKVSKACPHGYVITHDGLTRMVAICKN